jgi:hypothetical protein
MTYTENVIDFKGDSTSFPLTAGKFTRPVKTSGFASGNLALYGDGGLVVEVQAALLPRDRQGRPTEQDWLTKATFTGQGFYPITQLTSLVRLKVVSGVLRQAMIDASPELAGGAVISAGVGAVTGGGTTTPPTTTPAVDYAAALVRGTGGTIGRLTSRSGLTEDRVDLTPASPVEYFAQERLAFIDINNRAILPGQTGEVTGLDGFVAGANYYVEFPVGGGTNLKAYPNPVPDNWPDDTVLNANRRFYRAGVASLNNGKMLFTMFPDSIVAVASNVVAPPPVTPPAASTESLDLTVPTYNTNLVGSYVNEYLTFDGLAGSPVTLRADGDTPPQPATMPLSVVTRDIGGTVKGVYLSEKSSGTPKLHGLNATPSRLGGDVLMRFAIDSDVWDGAVPAVFVGWNGTPANGSFHEILMNGGVSNLYLELRKVVTANNVLTNTTLGVRTLAGTTMSRTVWYWIRVRVDGVNKTISARAWRDGDAEPAAFALNAVPAPDLVAGRAGWRSKDGFMEINFLKTTSDGVVA